MSKLTKTQQHTADKIVNIGREMGKTDAQIKTALKIAYNPKNRGVFDSIADAVQRLLGQWSDLDPSVVMTDQVLKRIRRPDGDVSNNLGFSGKR